LKKILYVDMDNVLVDFPSGIEQLDASVTQKYAGKLDEVPGIFSLMSPMPGAIGAFKELVELFDTYILSTAPWENPSAWSDKLLWVKNHIGNSGHKRLILTHHKNLNDGHFLIDDRTKNGADRFSGEHIHFGTERFSDWEAVLAYLRQNA
jgi:5'-nucleotidase